MEGIKKLAQYLFDKGEDEEIDLEEIEKAQCALGKLSANDKIIISKRYGIGEDKQYTLMELAETFGTDREWVRKNESRILQSLKKEIRQAKKSQ